MTQESELAELDLALKRLEVEKMRAEVDHARLAWWKRPGYVGGLVPIVLALVGLVTAWANGYFDTQRTQLATEIAALERERDTLNSKIVDAQRAIDTGYLEAKLAAYDADYAIGHFEAFSDSIEEINSIFGETPSDKPEFGAGLIFEMATMLEQQRVLGEATKEAVTNVLAQLDQIEATPWVKALETDPMLSAARRFRDPDGRIFDLASWDWVDE